MDFRQYCENLKIEQAEGHKNIITDLCVLLHNCADCTECNIKCMIHLLELCKVTRDSFRISGEYNNSINLNFLYLASKNYYKASFIEADNGNHFIEFKKR